MQTNSSKNAIKSLCLSYNRTFYLKRVTRYSLLMVIILLALISLTMEPGGWNNGISWVCIFFLLINTYILYNVLIPLFNPVRGRFGWTARPYLMGMKKSDILKLFGQVDKDIVLNGVSFGRLQIGKEWILEDGIMRIDNVAGIFCLAPRRQSSGYALVLVDRENYRIVIRIHDKSEAEKAYDYLKGLVPSAETGDYSQMVKFRRQHGGFAVKFKPITLSIGIPDVDGSEGTENDKRCPVSSELKEHWLKLGDTLTEDFSMDEVTAGFEDLKADKISFFMLCLGYKQDEFAMMSITKEQDKYKVIVLGFDYNGDARGYLTYTVYGGHVVNWLYNFYTHHQLPTITEDWVQVTDELYHNLKKMD